MYHRSSPIPRRNSIGRKRKRAPQISAAFRLSGSWKLPKPVSVGSRATRCKLSWRSRAGAFVRNGDDLTSAGDGAPLRYRLFDKTIEGALHDSHALLHHEANVPRGFMGQKISYPNHSGLAARVREHLDRSVVVRQ